MQIKKYSEFINEGFGRLVADDETVKEITSIDEIKDALLKYENFRFGEYLVIPTNRNKITCLIARNAPRSKFGYKIEQNFYYRKEEDMVKSVLSFFENISKRNTRIADEKQAKKDNQTAGLENIKDVIKSGDILYSSWGYDQTNVDFYQVLDVSERGTVSLRQISKETVKGSEGHDCAYVKPVKDSFIDDEIIKKRVTFSGNSYHVGSGYRTLYPYTSGDKGAYCSWYC